MALNLPPAVSISKFTGGYKSVLTYTSLMDTETADSQNVSYGTDLNVDKRKGSLRLYNKRLTSSTDSATGRPITGHYFFDKLGQSGSYHVVASGDSLYSYTSSTAVVIRTGLTDNSNTFWNFIQIQDPRSAADDIVVGTNGSNPIQVWTGSATAVALSSFTSATQVPVCKVILSHKERIYAINLIDATDADAGATVARTGFGSDGVADPHRFTEKFVVGGSDKSGELQNGAVLNDQIIFYKRGAIWKFNPTTAGTDLYQAQDSVGLLAPYSLVSTGDFHIFLSDRGVYAYDGNSLVHLSESIDNEFLNDANFSQLSMAKAVFDSEKSQYKLYFPSAGSNRNDRCLIYDIRPNMKLWQPPVTGRRVSYISTFYDSSGKKRVIYGDYSGYLYEDETGTNDGLSTGYNGTVSTSTASTITDATADFPTAGDGLSGFMVRIIEGTGEGQERVIGSNTSAVITLESGSTWTIIPDTTSKYTVTGIDTYWRSKDYEFGEQDITKIFRHINVRTREEGNFNLTLHYIIDFNDLRQAIAKDILLYEDGFVWGIGQWDKSVWGRRAIIRKKVSLRNTSSQSTRGNNLAVRFSNRRANETFRITGYDIEFKAYSKR